MVPGSAPISLWRKRRASFLPNAHRRYYSTSLTDRARSMPLLLTLSGSLRDASSNTALLSAARLLCPKGVTMAAYSDIRHLPHFDPDLDGAPPQTVVELRERITQADGLLISCPEYARGIPGAFKNALDWLVSCEDFSGKPVALFNASPRASHAQAALRLVLETMAARIIEPASITVNLLAKGATAQEIAEDSAIAPQLRAALEVFRAELQR